MLTDQEEAALAQELQRLRNWQLALIQDMGEDLRQCVRWMHDADPDGLTIVLATLKACKQPAVLQTMVSLYWSELSRQKGKV